MGEYESIEIRMKITKDQIKRFDIEGPRYTSYPTAPEWKDLISSETYEDILSQAGADNEDLSIYIHIPFCTQLCLYCGCHVEIKPVSQKEYSSQYVAYLLKEIDLIHERLRGKRRVSQFHFGGGTPTYLTGEQIKTVFDRIDKQFILDRQGEIAIEVDPRTTDDDKLDMLRQLGFNRISFGVQDFDLKVQKAINRVQPYELVESVYAKCRRLKFLSINFDLIYGLPYQTPDTFKKTVNLVNQLKPDRIALYSYAYIPWLKKHQKAIPENALPTPDEKLDIFLMARESFMRSGYNSIAMDHFALSDDELAIAFAERRLYRNFMGYTVLKAEQFIGLGVSSIGYIGKAFIQNAKELPEYYKALDRGLLPVKRGKLMTDDDLKRNWVIRSLMCQFQIDKKLFQNIFQEKFNTYFADDLAHIETCVEQGLLENGDHKIGVTDMGKIFIRNICIGFDWYYRQHNAHKRFSRTI